ncbi:hypothetical protein TWF173_005149 [Orbilia oligospora]|uniref:Uncharacterized protein n=1 Tax=Arthrobotrys oligospora (strain ATCC 24927 / CBS 115.81 / DSM 1491) TaxID=756982 RepID=G1XQT7_ARTOA|nr:hypothetical protein AOL_s00188g299 [Orbilia oligospora ATCC 24927]EGX44631.1 hypothetical protein AOL_s00188g299 [Orbilia oligospora ATCC 24927]KAF3314043.1 hypothetical protein TWF173_005149 [Orbilia oligospora]
MVVQVARIINLCKNKSIVFYNSEKITEITLPHSGHDIFEAAPCSPRILQNIPWKASNHKMTITIQEPDDGKDHVVSIIDDNYAFLLNGKRIGDLHPLERGHNPNGILLVARECPEDPHNHFALAIYKTEDWLEFEGNNILPWQLRKLLHMEPVATLGGW